MKIIFITLCIESSWIDYLNNRKQVSRSINIFEQRQEGRIDVEFPLDGALPTVRRKKKISITKGFFFLAGSSYDLFFLFPGRFSSFISKMFK